MRNKALMILSLVGVACSRPTHDSLTEKGLEKDVGDNILFSLSSVRSPSCPDDMVEVNGEYCPVVRETCLRWVNSRGEATEDAIPADGDAGRCGTFKYPTECLSKDRVHRHYCIDRFEYPNVAGERPQSWMSWYDVKAACASLGKRMCTRSEWTFACEGPEIRPLPYGDGYHRDSFTCNLDNAVPKGFDINKITSHDLPISKVLDDLLVPSGSKLWCVSTFGVHDMVGNIDEFVVNESGKPYVSGLMSGHVFGVRNACRPMTTAHGPDFSWYETGGRCCASTR